MKKKNLDLIIKKEVKFGKNFFFFKKRIKIKKRKWSVFARLLYYKSSRTLKLKRNYLIKYTAVRKFFNFVKYIILKKEFIFFKKFFLNLNFNHKYEYLLQPLYTFEKQFLFKRIEFEDLLLNSKNSLTFLKKNYEFISGPGINYLIRGDTVLNNVDIKNPVFFDKFEFFFVEKNFNFFELELNKNIFFFLLVDFYKILIFLQIFKLVN